MPWLAGGAVGGSPTSDALGSLYSAKIPVVSDLAGVLRGVLTELSWATIAALTLVPLTAFVLWRTSFGLRLRSSGEAPAAAESLGVKVIRLRYVAMAISGGLAGFGGAFLAIVASSAYREGQTANRGYIGLAIMIFGNWKPGGLLGGASLFGFTDALQLLGAGAIPSLFLFVAIVLVIIAGAPIAPESDDRRLVARFMSGRRVPGVVPDRRFADLGPGDHHAVRGDVVGVGRGLPTSETAGARRTALPFRGQPLTASTNC